MEQANTEYREALAQAGQPAAFTVPLPRLTSSEALLKELQLALGTALGDDTQQDSSKAIKSMSPL